MSSKRNSGQPMKNVDDDDDDAAIKERERAAARTNSRVVPNLANMVKDTSYSSLTNPSGEVRQPIQMAREADSGSKQSGGRGSASSKTSGKRMTRQEEEVMLKERERAARVVSRTSSAYSSTLVPNLASMVQDSSQTSLSSPISGRVQSSTENSSKQAFRQLPGPAMSESGNFSRQTTRQEEDVMLKERERSSRNSVVVPNLGSLMNPKAHQSAMSTHVSAEGPPVVPGIVAVGPPTVSHLGSMRRQEKEVQMKDRERAARNSARYRGTSSASASVVPNLASMMEPIGEASVNFAATRSSDVFSSNSGSSGVEPPPLDRPISQREQYVAQEERVQGAANYSSQHSLTSRGPRSTSSVPNFASQVTQVAGDANIQARYDAVAQILGDDDVLLGLQEGGTELMDHQFSESNVYAPSVGSDSFDMDSVLQSASSESVSQQPEVLPRFQPDAEDAVRNRHMAAAMVMRDEGQVTRAEEDRLLKERELQANRPGSRQQYSSGRSVTTQTSAGSTSSRGRNSKYDQDVAAKSRGRLSAIPQDTSDLITESVDVVTGERRIHHARVDAVAKSRGRRRGRQGLGRLGATSTEEDPAVTPVAPGALAVADGQAEQLDKGILTHVDMPAVQEYVARSPAMPSATVDDVGPVDGGTATVASSDGHYNVDMESRAASDHHAADGEGESADHHTVGLEEAGQAFNEEKMGERALSKRKWYIIGAILLLVIAGVAGGVVAASGGNGDDASQPSPTAAPIATAPPQSERFVTIRDILITNRVSSEKDLDDLLSPQYQALLWEADVDTDSLISDEPTLTSRYVLAVFYYSMNGENWVEGSQPWLDPDTDECTWNRITCLGGSAQAIREESAVNMVGTIPSELNALPNLVTLALHGNTVQDIVAPIEGIVTLELIQANLGERYIGIPSEIYEMTNLEFILLQGSGMIGTISTKIGKLTNLVWLNLDDNDLTGTLSSQFHPLINLSELSMNRNLWQEGNVMEIMRGITTLRVFQASSNSLTGSFEASELSRLSNLERLEVKGNRLDGPFPNKLFDLPKIGVVDLSQNSITGTLASDIGTPSNLQFMHFGGNLVTGTIPTEIGNLDRLIQCRMSFNLLNGTIPSQMGQLEQLDRLEIDNNQLMGTIPTELGQMRSLSYMQVSGNFLSGVLPTEICEMESLTLVRLTVGGNQDASCGDCTKCS